MFPLLWGLDYAIEINFPIEEFVQGLFTDYENAPSGGDPGWAIYKDRVEDGRAIFHAWTDPNMSYLDPSEADYEEWIVKRRVREALEEFLLSYPSRAALVARLIERYEL